MNNQPIGFIDSGVGGLSVVKEVMERLPAEEIQFIGDSARNPYGPRSPKEVLQFTKELAYFLLQQNIKILVIACNTATVAALDELQKELNIPVIGVIKSGSRGAVTHSQNKKIGVIGTETTIQSGEYTKKLKELNQSIEVFNTASPKFVEIVENNQFKSEYAKTVVESELKDLKETNIDTLILGCTHYPLLEPLIQEFLGKEICLIDPSIETVKTLKNVLEERGLVREKSSNPIKHTFYTTGDREKFETITKNWLPNYNFQVMHISLEELQKYNG